MDPSVSPHPGKQHLRTEALARRRLQPGREEVSRAVLDRLWAMPEYVGAQTVLSYVSFRHELSTRELLDRAWSDGKQLAVPYCVDDHLELFRIEGLGDLEPGMMGILEPKAELRHLPERKVAVERLDLVVVPGVAFDVHCGRLGYGKGYYDRLLRHASPQTALVALAFECQVFPEVPMMGHDVRVDKLLTERSLYVRTGPRFGKA